MSSTEESFEKTIEAAKIALKAEEKKVLQHQLDKFLAWLEVLTETGSEGFAAAPHYTGAEHTLREDLPEESSLAPMQKEASHFEEGFYIVPRIID